MTQTQAFDHNEPVSPQKPQRLAPQPPDWEWTHEDNLINHRLMWLILSEGLLFTAYGTISTAKMHWLVYGFPFFGIAVAAVIGVSIFAAIAATEYIQQQFDA
jgi:hypothetical protein